MKEYRVDQIAKAGKPLVKLLGEYRELAMRLEEELEGTRETCSSLSRQFEATRSQLYRLKVKFVEHHVEKKNA